jgi:hypothetical protein
MEKANKKATIASDTLVPCCTSDGSSLTCTPFRQSQMLRVYVGAEKLASLKPKKAFGPKGSARPVIIFVIFCAKLGAGRSKHRVNLLANPYRMRLGDHTSVRGAYQKAARPAQL